MNYGTKQPRSSVRLWSVELLESRRLLAGDLALVRYYDTWNGGTIPSSDPASITYYSPHNTFLIADSEIDEIPSVFAGHNIFEVTPAGDTVIRSIASGSSEPTGIVYNEADGYFYVTNDDTAEITRYDASFSAPLLTVRTTNANANAADPEGITANPITGDIFVAQGISGGKQVLVYNQQLEYQRSFSVGDRIIDPEGIAYNPQNDLLYLVSAPDMRVFAYTTNGQFVNSYSLDGLQPPPTAPEGLTFGPTSNPNDAQTNLALYIADGMIDNGLDGRIYETVLVNAAPIVNGGVDQLALTGDTVSLVGTAIDDSLPIASELVTTEWLVVTGPGTVTFGNRSAPSTTATFSHPGTYVLRLSASDGELTGSDELTIDVIPRISAGQTIYFTLAASTTLPGGITVSDEDIVRYDGTSFSVWFDGSDVGLAAKRIDAFAIQHESEVLISFAASGRLAGVAGIVDDSDIVRFVASSIGSITSGQFSLYFDGSDVDLNLSGEDIDAVEIMYDGSLLISTTAAVTVPGISAQDEDLLRFVPTSLGPETSGTWQWYVDGSDVGLGPEDIDAVSIGAQGEVYFSLVDVWKALDRTVDDEDVAVFMPQWVGATTHGSFASGLLFDGSSTGLGTNKLIALDVVQTVGPQHVVPDTVNANVTDSNRVRHGALASGGVSPVDADDRNFFPSSLGPANTEIRDPSLDVSDLGASSEDGIELSIPQPGATRSRAWGGLRCPGSNLGIVAPEAHRCDLMPSMPAPDRFVTASTTTPQGERVPRAPLAATALVDQVHAIGSINWSVRARLFRRTS